MKRFLVLLVVFCIVFVGCVSDNSDKGAMYYFNKGLEADDAGDCEKAIEYYDKALEEHAELYSAMQNKAICLNQLDRKEEAISTIDQMLNETPNFSILWFWKGNMFFDLGRYNESVTSYRKAIQVYDEDNMSRYEKQMTDYSSYPFEVWYNMCLSLANLDRYNESIDACKNALEFDPSYVDAYCDIAVSYSYKGDYQKALQMYNSALDYESSDPSAIYGKTRTLILLDRWQDAYDTIERLPSKYWNRKFYYLKGVVLYGLGRYDESLGSVNRSLQIEEDKLARKFYDAVVEAKQDPDRKVNVTKYLEPRDMFQ